MAEVSFQSSRRALVMSGVAVAASALARSVSKPLVGKPPAPEPTAPQPLAPPRPARVPAAVRGGPAEPRFGVDRALLDRARAALDAHSRRIPARDRIVIVDFAAPSSEARLHLVDIAGGKASRLLVAHGSGSDPGHTGYLRSFSNDFGSNASSQGAFLTDDYYVGKHGRSQRLIGLDATNDNALARAVVVHSAWYANEDMVAAHGKLGRSQGCFAVGETKLDDVFAFLGKGRMIYAARA